MDRWVKMLLKRELPFDDVPRLWEACWCASAGLTPISTDSQPHDGRRVGSGGPRIINGTAGVATADLMAVDQDFVLYCCAAVLQQKQKEIIKSGKSLEDLFHCLRGVHYHAPELLRWAARLAQSDVQSAGG